MRNLMAIRRDQNVFEAELSCVVHVKTIKCKHKCNLSSLACKLCVTVLSGCLSRNLLTLLWQLSRVVSKCV